MNQAPGQISIEDETDLAFFRDSGKLQKQPETQAVYVSISPKLVRTALHPCFLTPETKIKVPIWQWVRLITIVCAIKTRCLPSREENSACALFLFRHLI